MTGSVDYRTGHWEVVFDMAQKHVGGIKPGKIYEDFMSPEELAEAFSDKAVVFAGELHKVTTKPTEGKTWLGVDLEMQKNKAGASLVNTSGKKLMFGNTMIEPNQVLAAAQGPNAATSLKKLTGYFTEAGTWLKDAPKFDLASVEAKVMAHMKAEDTLIVARLTNTRKISMFVHNPGGSNIDLQPGETVTVKVPFKTAKAWQKQINGLLVEVVPTSPKVKPETKTVVVTNHHHDTLSLNDGEGGAHQLKIGQSGVFKNVGAGLVELWKQMPDIEVKEDTELAENFAVMYDSMIGNEKPVTKYVENHSMAAAMKLVTIADVEDYLDLRGFDEFSVVSIVDEGAVTVIVEVAGIDPEHTQELHDDIRDRIWPMTVCLEVLPKDE